MRKGVASPAARLLENRIRSEQGGGDTYSYGGDTELGVAAFAIAALIFLLSLSLAVLPPRLLTSTTPLTSEYKEGILSYLCFFWFTKSEL